MVASAVALGTQVGDLAAIIGVELPDKPRSGNPLAADTAELLWNLRRLSVAQATRVRDEAWAMVVAIPDDTLRDESDRIHHQHGVW